MSKQGKAQVNPIVAAAAAEVSARKRGQSKNPSECKNQMPLFSVEDGGIVASEEAR